jgi:hypothetical protein
MSKMSGVPAGMPRPAACATASLAAAVPCAAALAALIVASPNPATHEAWSPTYSGK